MVGFAALMVTGLAVDPDLGRYAVAADSFCRGVWDFGHFTLDKVVSRSVADLVAVGSVPEQDPLAEKVDVGSAGVSRGGKRTIAAFWLISAILL
ncbi:hypothetical protein ACQP1W_34645 [Spirillospora sp. CA-255316]